MADLTPGMIFTDTLRNKQPDALAWIRGNAQNPQLSGIVKFYETPYAGVLVEAEIFGLPNIATPFSSFDKTGNHYNPTKEPHPDHAGDLIPLMGNQGYAWLAFYDKRFQISEIMGRSVVIHTMPDDFKSQPSGDAGGKIGCGVIR